jgi:hypothetical protein
VSVVSADCRLFPITISGQHFLRLSQFFSSTNINGLGPCPPGVCGVAYAPPWVEHRIRRFKAGPNIASPMGAPMLSRPSTGFVLYFPFIFYFLFLVLFSFPKLEQFQFYYFEFE